MLCDAICMNALAFELLEGAFASFLVIRGQELVQKPQISAVVDG